MPKVFPVPSAQRRNRRERRRDRHVIRERTRVCCTDRSAPAQREMAAEPGFRSPNQPTKRGDRYVTYLIRAGFAVGRHECYHSR